MIFYEYKSAREIPAINRRRIFTWTHTTNHFLQRILRIVENGNITAARNADHVDEDPNTESKTFSMIDRSTFHENLEVLLGLQHRLSKSRNLLSNLSSSFSLWIRRTNKVPLFGDWKYYWSPFVLKRCLHKVTSRSRRQSESICRK